MDDILVLNEQGLEKLVKGMLPREVLMESFLIRLRHLVAECDEEHLELVLRPASYPGGAVDVADPVTRESTVKLRGSERLVDKVQRRMS